MCGRTACTLDPDAICTACSYKDKHGKLQRPVWKDSKNKELYKPSYNISPSQYTPVIVSSQHYGKELDIAERIIQPMRWGLIPSWHKGHPNDLQYETNNCKAESMMEKKTFKVPLEKGRRCVVLAEGFYEWKRTKGVKQPYFITFQEDESKTVGEVAQKVTSSEYNCTERDSLKPGHTEEFSKKEVKSEEKPDVSTNIKQESCPGKSQKALLRMAGVFDICKPAEEKEENLYSYSVLTVAASSVMADIHHRMPAILCSEEDVEKWLNFGEVPMSEAAKIIKPRTCLELYPVSTVVNNSRNNTPECIKPIDLKKPKSFLQNWLKVGQSKVKTESEEDQVPPSKKMKLEQ